VVAQRKRPKLDPSSERARAIATKFLSEVGGVLKRSAHDETNTQLWRCGPGGRNVSSSQIVILDAFRLDEAATRKLEKDGVVKRMREGAWLVVLDRVRKLRLELDEFEAQELGEINERLTEARDELKRLRGTRKTATIMDAIERQKTVVQGIEGEVQALHERHRLAQLGDCSLVKRLKERPDLEQVQEEEFEVVQGRSRYYLMRRVKVVKEKKVWDDKFGQMDIYKH
jgi:hypothetical protein